MRPRLYKVTNISGQRITLKIWNQQGEEIEDYLEIDEVVYGLNDNAIGQLIKYEWEGAVKIEETEFLEEPKVRWLVEGF